MSDKYLDDHGVGTLWAAIKRKFVQQVSGKGLSAEDYTTAEKTKLAGIEAGANNYALPTASGSVKGGIKVGSHLSVDENGVLSAEAGATDAMVINAGVARFSDGETVTIESLAIAELEQAAEDGRSVFLRLSMEGTHDTRILPLYRVVKSVISPGSTTPVDRYTFGFATDKTTMKLLISVDGENYTAEPLYLKTLSASELNALPSSEKGAANGVAPLGMDSLIAEAYIPDVYVRNVSGKGLSSNDYTSAEKSKLASMPAAADIVQKTEKGEANGVCPLGNNRTIPAQFLPEAADSITEVAASGVWEYVKYASGRIELTARLSASITSDQWAAWGSGGLYYGTMSAVLPVQLTKDPNITYSARNSRALSGYAAYDSQTNTVSVELYRPSAANVTQKVDIRITGKYK